MVKFAGKVEDKSGICGGMCVLFLAVCSLDAGMSTESIGSAALALLGVAIIGYSFSKNSIMSYLGLLSFGIVLTGVVLFVGVLFGFAFLEGMANFLEAVGL